MACRSCLPLAGWWCFLSTSLASGQAAATIQTYSEVSLNWSHQVCCCCRIIFVALQVDNNIVNIGCTKGKLNHCHASTKHHQTLHHPLPPPNSSLMPQHVSSNQQAAKGNQQHQACKQQETKQQQVLRRRVELNPRGGGLKPDKSGICTQVLGSHPPC